MSVLFPAAVAVRRNRNPGGRVLRSSTSGTQGSKGRAARTDSTITGSPVSGSRRALPLSRSTGRVSVLPRYIRRRRVSVPSCRARKGIPHSSGTQTPVAGKNQPLGRPFSSQTRAIPP